MAEITINGRAASRATLTIPRLGAWVAEVEADTADDLTGRVTLVVDGRAWVGTVARGGVHDAVWRGRIVGGAGGLASTIPALALHNTPLSVALDETLTAAGETRSTTSGDLSARVARWHRREAPAHHAVADVAKAAGYAWRVLADGTVWMGAETWADATPRTTLEVLVDDRRAGSLVVTGENALDLAPGTSVTLAGRAVRVGCVEHRASPDEARTVLLEEREADAASASGRLLAAFDALVARVTRRLDYAALYPARVVQQRADGSLDVIPDDTRVPSCQRVPYRSLPGVTVEVPAGSRVLLGYEGADPARPIALLWELGDVTRLTINGGSRRVARQGDATTGHTHTVVTDSGTYTTSSAAPTIAEGSDVLRVP